MIWTHVYNYKSPIPLLGIITELQFVTVFLIQILSFPVIWLRIPKEMRQTIGIYQRIATLLSAFYCFIIARNKRVLVLKRLQNGMDKRTVGRLANVAHHQRGLLLDGRIQ